MAEELIELGDPRAPLRRRRYLLAKPGASVTIAGGAPVIPQTPFLSGRSVETPRMGDVIGDIVGFLGDVLGTAIGVIADIVSAPLELLASGVDWVLTNLATALTNIPILGELVAEILLIGNAVIKFALSLPGMLLHELEGLLKGLGDTFSDSLSEGAQDEALAAAKGAILGNTPADMRKDVDNILSSTPTGQVASKNEPVTSGLEEALMVGFPIAAAAAVFAFVL